jgi:HPt (histidine-containing phosphotransfer) domain-containing protein
MDKKLYNLNYLRELSSGDKDFEDSMINYFVSNAPEILDNVDQLIADEDWKEIREVIHKFIPNLNMMGAEDFIPTANTIEINTEQGINLESVPGLWVQLREWSVQLIAQLKEDFNY